MHRSKALQQQTYHDVGYSVQLLFVYEEQEEQRLKLGEDVVASNRTIDECESCLLSDLKSTYRCLTDDNDFISRLADTKVSAILRSDHK